MATPAETSTLVTEDAAKEDELAGEVYPTVPIGALFRYCDSYDKFLLFVGILSACTQGAAMPAFSFMFGELMEGLMDPNPAEASRKTMDASWIFLYVAGAMLFAAGLNVWAFELLAERQLLIYRREYFSAVLRQDIAWFDKNGGLELPSSISGDTSLMREGIGMKFGQGVMGAFTFLLSYVFAFLRGWQLALVMCMSIPVLAIVTGVGATLLGSMTKKSAEAYASAGAVAEESLGNMRTVAAFGGEAKAESAYLTRVVKAKAVGVSSAHAAGINMGLMMCVMFMSYGLGFWYGAKLVTDEDRLTNNWTGDPWTGGDVMATFFAALMGGMMLGQMGPTVSAGMKAKGGAAKMYHIIATDPTIDSSATGKTPNGGSGEFVLADVRFRYPTRPDVPLFEGLNLTIPGGKTTALVGESGSGKSTIVALLQRFYDVDSGSIRIDGVDLKAVDMAWLRAMLGLVSQEPVLFATSIEDNIRYGKKGATDAEVQEAARSANAHDFISSFDKGYKTYVGEKGSQISGGQKQRIAIARALIHDPKILLLDEATSALDNQSQREVQDTLDHIMSTRQLTCVVIAHRLSTIRDADKICVFDRGQLVQEGTHASLLAEKLTSLEKNVYSNLVAGQDAIAQEAHVSTAAAKQHSSGGANADSDHRNPNESVTPGADTKSAGGGKSDAYRMVAKPEEGGETEEAAADGKEKIWTYGEIMRLGGGCSLLVLGSLGAIVAGVAMPVWALFFTDINKGFYMCEPWSPADLFAMSQADTTLSDALSERGTAAFGGDFATRIANNVTTLWGLAEPFGYGVYDDYRDCANEQIEKCNFAALMFVFLGLGLGLAEYVKNMAYEAMKQICAMNLRTQLFKALIWKEIGFFDSDQNTSGALTSRLAADCGLVSGVLGPQMGSAFQSMTTLAVGLVIAFTSSWQLSLAVLGFMPLLSISAKIQNDMFMGLSSAEQGSSAVANQLASESIQGIRTVRAFNIEKEVIALYESLILDDPKRLQKQAVTAGLGVGLSQCLMFALYWVAFLYGGYLIKAAGTSGADVMQCFMAMMMAGFGIGMASMAVPDKAKSAAAADVIFGMIQKSSGIDASSRAGVVPSEFDGAVNLKAVSFHYPANVERQILKGITLSIDAGKTTALVGPSGSGKSTVVALLQRFYDISGGSLTLGAGGPAISSLNLEWWRKQIGFVGQEPVLFKMSIRDNIRYGNPDATDAEIVAAATRAFAHDFIMNKTDDQYETNVGERGLTMSGGQKQRIAIARALVRMPKLLLLDEATSALDTESEHEVQEAIDSIIAKEKMTCVVIAHRLNSIRNADKIVVFEEGSLLEQGTHDSLVALGGLYAELASGGASSNNLA